VELATLAQQGEHFRRIIAPEPDDIIHELCTFLETYDIRTAYPLLLALMDARLSTTEWRKVSEILESYLLRRAVCNLGTKNYNRVFLSLTRNLRKEGFTADQLKALLLAQTGESVAWPDDAAFREAWLHKPLYGPLNNAKLVHLYTRLNQTFMSSKSESLVFDTQPSVEHIMPQKWPKNWPLPDGTAGMDEIELYLADPSDPRAMATRKRDTIIQTAGNLTILSTSLNSAQSNLAWDRKRPEMAKHSLLPLNQEVLSTTVWDEAAIFRRGEALFEKALKIWPR
jgi:hypothetical protein